MVESANTGVRVCFYEWGSFGLRFLVTRGCCSQGVFDFGPLLCGRPSAAARNLYTKTNQSFFDSSEESNQTGLGVVIPEELLKYHEVLTLRNDSPFPTVVRCSLQGNGGGGGPGGALNSPPDTGRKLTRFFRERPSAPGSCSSLPSLCSLEMTSTLAGKE